MGVVNVRLTVDDGINEPTDKSVSVLVIHGLIVPGEAAAGIKLGDTFDRVKAIYGEPSSRRNALFAYWNPDRGFAGALDGIGLVDGLFIRHPNKAKTVGGVGIGSPRERVEGEFGLAEEIQEGGKEHWYLKKGIEFDYDADAKVVSIFVFKPVGAAPSAFDDVEQREQASENKAALDGSYSTE